MNYLKIEKLFGLDKVNKKTPYPSSDDRAQRDLGGLHVLQELLDFIVHYPVAIPIEDMRKRISEIVDDLSGDSRHVLGDTQDD